MPVNKNHHRETYRKRFDKVFDYIERHLDEALLLEQLSEVAHFSPYHFTASSAPGAACRRGVTSS